MAGSGADERVSGFLERVVQDARANTGAKWLPGPAPRSFGQKLRVRNLQVNRRFVASTTNIKNDRSATEVDHKNGQ